MMNKLTLSAVLALVVAVVAATPAEAAVTIRGNARNSVNRVRMTNRVSHTNDQLNSSNTANVVTADADTGNNDVADTTGGSVNTTSGIALTDVMLINTGNTNTDSQADCDCVVPEVPSVTIMENARGSENTVRLSNRMRFDNNQTNNSTVSNVVTTTTNTGGNDVSDTTGGGVTVRSGNSTTYLYVTNTGNSNVNN